LLARFALGYTLAVSTCSSLYTHDSPKVESNDCGFTYKRYAAPLKTHMRTYTIFSVSSEWG